MTENTDNKDSISNKSERCGLTFCDERYPKSAFLINGFAFCQKFCWYGIQVVVQTYLAVQLKLHFDVAGTIFHTLEMVSFFVPMLVAILSDSLTGRYWTIIGLSVGIVIGCSLLTASSAIANGSLAGSIAAFFLVAICSGGLHPCLSPFGADQFPDAMAKHRQSFFSLHYIALNFGAFLGMIFTPELKSIACLGYDSCWVLSFGVPSALMVVALLLFLIGTPFYVRAPVLGGVTLKMLKVIWLGIKRAFQSSKQHVDHWLDRAVGPEISQEFVNDCKYVLRLFVLFLPLSIFSTLYGQQGSRWTYQAQKMDCYMDLFGWAIQPEQMQMANSVMVVLIVPLFDMAVYPLLNKCKLLAKPLQRMVAGCVLLGLSFVVVGLIQIAVEQQNDPIDNADMSTYRLRAYNFHSNCSFDVSSSNNPSILLKPYESHLFVGGNSLKIAATSQECRLICPDRTMNVNDQNVTAISSLIISSSGLNCQAISSSKEFTFPKENEFLFQIQASLITAEIPPEVESLSIANSAGAVVWGPFYPSNYSSKSLADPLTYYESPYFRINKPGLFRVKTVFANGTVLLSDNEFLLKQGGAYNFYTGPLTAGSSSMTAGVKLLLDKNPNAVSIFWQLIPYFVLTIAEILFTISSMSFTFSQAPASMKATVQAIFMFTVSLGNLIAIIVINIQIRNKAAEFFVFAAMLFVATVVFGIMCYYYRPSDAKSGNSSNNFEKHDDKEMEMSKFLANAKPTGNEETVDGVFKNRTQAQDDCEREPLRKRNSSQCT